jgi:hypothetical protein
LRRRFDRDGTKFWDEVTLPGYHRLAPGKPLEAMRLASKFFRDKAYQSRPTRSPRNTGPMLASPRCGAKTRSGKPCMSPAVRGKKRCRMHGGARGKALRRAIKMRSSGAITEARRLRSEP